jgi:hypothetical protein
LKLKTAAAIPSNECKINGALGRGSSLPNFMYFNSAPKCIESHLKPQKAALYPLKKSTLDQSAEIIASTASFRD